MAQILVFGDSISYGAWDKEGGWVQRLRRFFDEQNLSELDEFYCLVYNLGVDGDTTDGLLKRFASETLPRMWEGEETIIVFAIGSNDSCFVQTKNIFMTTENKFKKNLQKLIKLAQKFSTKVIFVGLSQVEESKTNPIPWDTNKSYKNEHIKKYNEIIKLACKENKIYFIEIFDNWKKLNYKKLLEEGVHPNSEGHQKIFELVKSFLIKNNIIT